jgi:hypothetical protein
MKAYWVVDVQTHIFLTSALLGGEWSASRPGRFTPQGKYPRAGLDDVEKYRDSKSNPSVVQPVASRYTDYSIPAPTTFSRD